MNKIKIKTNPWYSLIETFVADINDDNAEVRMLYEAVVSKVEIDSEGEITYYVKVANDDLKEYKTNDLDLYYNSADYRAGQIVQDAFISSLDILERLGVSSKTLGVEHVTTGEKYVVPRGFFINDHTLVEAVDFPATFTFTREIKLNDSNALVIGDWTHNANFNGKTDMEIYNTREEALENHRVKLKKFGGMEILI